jgi:hypothetical protein
VAPRARPIRCEGVFFSFIEAGGRVAFVSGLPEAAFVAVDGAQVYPRRGRARIASGPAWSRDGRSLAFLETPAEAPARLVLLAEFDNPTGDTTWDLPAAMRLDGARVFWIAPGTLAVGKNAMKPLFTTSFVKEVPRSP